MNNSHPPLKSSRPPWKQWALGTLGGVGAAAAFTLVRGRLRHSPAPAAAPAPREENHDDQALWRRLKLGALIAAGVFVLVFLALFFIKRQHLAKERSERQKQAAKGPPVQTAKVSRSAAERSLVLVGEARPFAEVTLYAKVSGYLRRVRFDKGDTVAAGELLAEIESPETDRDYDAALANALNLRKVARRERALLARRFVSQQEAEQASTNAAMAEDQAKALKTLKGYEQLRAPFDGVVTARYADGGALIQSAANGQAGALPVFTVSDTRKLRVFAYVDQADAALVHPGDAALLVSQERPDVKVQGRVARLAGELEARTRTLLTEIDLDNGPGYFVPGSYLRVTLSVAPPSFPTIPAGALVLSGTAAYVAAVDGQSRVHYKRIEIGDNDGVNVQVVAGLAEGERVALNLGKSVKEGSRVDLGEGQGSGSGSGSGQGSAAGEGSSSGPGSEELKPGEDPTEGSGGQGGGSGAGSAPDEDAHKKDNP